eukprot:gnl/TRDRNA2_/TRDRNA2_48748_c0_seq1.p1 gnl/TRDRNA2_/TRDRNA2_48748_c0~~gnl/TRDRNA2_/TRDRNA2_48748_c0_seq1.p1  ORF type:complete len:190 (+),score=62.44 gnl/TRDRNA2_/TRDRNA2_48748_c0_seq1:84-653(+)
MRRCMSLAFAVPVLAMAHASVLATEGADADDEPLLPEMVADEPLLPPAVKHAAAEASAARKKRKLLLIQESMDDARLENVEQRVEAERDTADEDPRLRRLLSKNGALETRLERLQGTGEQLREQLTQEEQLQENQKLQVSAAQKVSHDVQMQLRHLQIIVGLLLAVICTLSFWWWYRFKGVVEKGAQSV